MTMNTSLPGRLRNTQLSSSRGMFPLFEAIVNSIQSVDDAHGDSEHRGYIEIEIERDSQTALDFRVSGKSPLEPIVGFHVRDNGTGFNAENMTSFETLDSEYKIKHGCRGVGRLLWLKAFDRVRVRSVFQEDGSFKERRFAFDAANGVTDHEVIETVKTKTFAVVSLVGFKKAYQQGSRKMTQTIVRDILEHCLWYFVRDGGAPDIVVRDGDELLNLRTAFEDYMRSAARIDRFAVRGRSFDLIHLKLKTNAKAVPTINWCAANRVVWDERISGAIPGLHGTLSDTEGEFTYSGYLTSAFLDERVRPERTGFDLDDTEPESGGSLTSQESLLDVEPSQGEIRDAVLASVGNFLAGSLTTALVKGRDRIEEFVSDKAPRYRPILGRLEEKGVSIDPTLNDKELELELHKQLTAFEVEVLREGHEVLDPTVLDLGSAEWVEKLDEYLSKVEDVKKSDLAAYVSRRKLILQLLSQAIERSPEGKYVKEDYIHNLIMPMRSTSDDGTHRASNLWIIDERLSFHNYLASDKPLQAMPITGSTSRKEPDLLALQLCNSPILVGEGSAPTWASISIIEFKRPMRDDAASGPDKDPIEQCLNYLQLVRDGGVQTARGRVIPNAEALPAFCYIVADLTKSLRARCKMHRLNPTDDGLGYFGYHDSFNAYIEVISFDRLLQVANRRNRAFFDVLGIPVN